MKLHQVSSICPICSSIEKLGQVDMTGQEIKYICPECKSRHYGEPEQVKFRSYKCGGCDKITKRNLWEKIPMDADEIIMGPMQSCAKCNAKIADGNIAFIEIKNGGEGEKDRTGKLVFMKPDEKSIEQFGSAKVVYIEAAALAKRMEG